MGKISHMVHFRSQGGEGRGTTEVHVIYPKKSQLQNLSTQKSPYFFLAYTPKNPTLAVNALTGMLLSIWADEKYNT